MFLVGGIRSRRAVRGVAVVAEVVMMFRPGVA